MGKLSQNIVSFSFLKFSSIADIALKAIPGKGLLTHFVRVTSLKATIQLVASFNVLTKLSPGPPLDSQARQVGVDPRICSLTGAQGRRGGAASWQCFSQHGLWAGSITVTWELTADANSPPLPPARHPPNPRTC